MNNYYTPEIEDLFIGYEGLRVNYVNGMYEAVALKDGIAIANIIDLIDIAQTKYLDKEDIEKCEWKLYDRELKSYSDWCKFKSKDWELYVQLNDKYFPRLLNLKARGHCYWNGNVKIYCKSINELRKIMKMIGIK